MKTTKSITAFGLGFGTNGIDNKETLVEAIRQGYRLIDAADLYHNAATLAKAIEESGMPRADFFINYKILPNLGTQDFLERVDQAIAHFTYLDCLMLHDLVADETQIREILQALQPYLGPDGPIKTLGLSNVYLSNLQALKAEFPQITIVQNSFSHREPDTAVRQYCQQHDLQYMGYGIFGGRLDLGECGYQFNTVVSAWNVSTITYPDLHAIAKKYQRSPQFMLLCWAVQQDAIQIPSTAKPERMQENKEAAELAATMSKHERDALAAALTSSVDNIVWEKIVQEAAAGNRLAQLKQMVGKNSPRHRLLDALYQDQNLKAFFDFILDRSANQTDRILALCHFMEECLREGNDCFDSMIIKFNHILKNSRDEREKARIFDLLSKLEEVVQPKSRMLAIEKFVRELNYFNQHGYFTIKSLQLPRRLGDQTIPFLGPNKIIYILRGVPMRANLREIGDLLAEQFPRDFQDKKILAQFYLPVVPEGGVHEVTELEKYNFVTLQYSPGYDIYGLAGQADCRLLMEDFFHMLSADLAVFTGGVKVEEYELKQDSEVCQLIRARCELERAQLSLDHEKGALQFRAGILATMKAQLREAKQDPSYDQAKYIEKKQEYQARKASYREDVEDVANEERQLNVSVKAYVDRLKQHAQANHIDAEANPNQNDEISTPKKEL